MRDPKHPASWSDTLAVRVQYQETQAISEHRNARSQRSPTSSDLAPVDEDTSIDENLRPDLDSGEVLESFDFDSFLSHCEVMRFSSTSLTTLRSLPPTSVVLLLTPVLIPVPTPRMKDQNSTSKFGTTIDPFEIFGRELSKSHHRLRHVPYVPQVGMTTTHAAFIKQAAAVVVVVCEPIDSSNGSLANQYSFADEVLWEHEDSFDEEQFPTVLVRFGPDDIDEADRAREPPGYETVLYASRATEPNMVKAAERLYTTDLSKLKKKAAGKAANMQLKAGM